MKKIFLAGALAVASVAIPDVAQGQSILSNVLGALGQQQETSSQTTGNDATPTQSTQDVLGNILGGVLGSATSSDGSSATGGLINDLLATVTGGATTTKASMVGTWTYTEPAVQFESENLLAKAGSSIASSKLEQKLEKYYKIVGIKAGTLVFTFNQDGTCTYSIGKRSMTGTWEFDSSTKIVTITTAAGLSVNTYVTVSGSQLSLCFDGTKVLTLFTNMGSKLSALNSTLGTIAALASNYDGMKVGFAFKKQ